jgi:DNA-binding transcriptional regulator GbsR (MarR family)
MTKSPSTLKPAVRRLVGDAGSLSQSFGLGRAIGQIYAFLYFSPRPRNLDDMCAGLGISKGSASTCVRQLEQWGAVRKVWVHGDRKDYYEANEWIGRVVRNVINDVVGRRLLASGNAVVNGAEDLPPADSEDPDAAFVAARLEDLRRFKEKARKAWSNPIVQRLMK